MIREIINFIDYLEESDRKNNTNIFSENLELREGIYVFLEKEGEELMVKEENIFKVYKDMERNKMYDDYLAIATNTEMLNAMKSYNSGPKVYIAIGSPFGIALNGKAYKKNAEKKLLDSAEAYFKAARKFMTPENEEHEKWCKELEYFVKTKMLDFLASDETNKKAKDQFMFYFFMKEPKLEDYREIQSRFLAEKLFNKDKFNIKDINGDIYGISDNLSGFNDSKEFLKHKTAPIELNYRVSGNEAQKLFQFFNLQQKNKILPNPFPLFVDEQELSGEAVKFFKNDKKAGHKEIMESLLKTRDKDLQNYYLIYFNNREKGSRIVDLDFVSVFKHKFEKEMRIETFFNTTNNAIHFNKIENVFDFERIIIQKIFNNQLVQKWKDESYSLKYFDEIDNNPKYITANTYIQIMKYRKTIFDFIYKSKHQLITDVIFQDIMKNSTLDDIRHDKFDDKFKSHSKEKDIKGKLNIWFSLYNYFKTTNQKKIDMANNIEKHRELVASIADGNQNITDDEGFAFVAGQVVYYLLSKSKSSDKSYSLLEPFLQKSNYIEFRKALHLTFNTYKHENFSNRFKNPFANVLDYIPTTNLKDLMPTFLAGFFSNNELFATKKEDNNNN